VPITFNDPVADAGKNAAFGEGQCVACHRDIRGDEIGLNFNANTGVERLLQPTASRPRDSGFGVAPNPNLSGFGNGQFNMPPLLEAADTAPFFHNNAIQTIEEAVDFYRRPEFQSSPGFSFTRPDLNDQRVTDIGAFLRTINALLNIQEVRKVTSFVKNNPANGNVARANGNTDILKVAIADTNDAIEVLTVSSLSTNASATARNALVGARALLEHAATHDDSTRHNTMIQAEAYLSVAKNSLMTPNPAFPQSDF
jgi:hypothetical protein